MIFEARNCSRRCTSVTSRTEARQEIRLLHGRIAAADHHDLAIAVKRAVAGGAGADAVADQLLFVRQSQPSRRRAGGDDQGAGFMPFAVDIQAEGRAKIGLRDRAVHVLGAEALGLLLHVFDQVGAVDAFGKSGKILDLGGDGELAAGLMPDHDQRFQTGAGGIDRGGISGAARADNDDVSHNSILTIEMSGPRWRARNRSCTAKCWEKRRAVLLC